MPVLATLAAVSFLFPAGSNEASFLNWEVLRARCKNEIEDVETRDKAVQLTEELQRLTGQYQQVVLATMDTYRDESEKWESAANGLIELLQPLDEARAQVLQDIVHVRQSMHELLTPEQWLRVFR